MRPSRRCFRMSERRAGPLAHGAMPLVLIHGFLGSSESWNPILAGLSQRYDCFAVDLPGHGGSPAPSDRHAYRIERIVDHVVSEMDDSSIGPCVLMGYSLGGRIALHVAVRRPDRVRMLILESASPGIEDQCERTIRAATDERLATMIDHKGMLPFVEYWENLPLFASQRALPETATRVIRDVRLATDPRAAAQTLRHLSPGVLPSLWTQLRDVTMPVLCLAGSLDHMYLDVAERTARSVANGVNVVIADAGHACHLEQPGLVQQAVNTWLTSPHHANTQ
jgi:2-succinyl-6-hydroxy-2,4-cyclohexadiene-1-carboxylate synthase